MPYFRVRTGYLFDQEKKRKSTQVTHHVIRADDFVEAKDIATRHKIAYPIGAEDIASQDIYELSSNSDTLNRRKSRLGGSIWFENENRELCIEEM